MVTAKSENEIEVNGVKFIRADSIKAMKPKETRKGDGGIRIVILQRGWIVVGHYYDDGTQFRVDHAAVIRKWGTTNGLGEIALGGTTAKTVLDNCGTVRGHVLAIVACVDCDADKWLSRA